MIATTLLGFNNDPTLKNLESINSTLSKIYDLDKKESGDTERHRRFLRQEDKRKEQREKRNAADNNNPIKSIVKDKKEKNKLGKKVNKLFEMLKDGLGGMLSTLGPLLTSLGAFLTSAVFLKIVAILAVGAILVTLVKSEKFKTWMNDNVLDPIAKVFTEELPNAFKKVMGFDVDKPTPDNGETSDTSSSPTKRTEKSPTNGVDVLIPLDHTKAPGTVPDTPGGDTFRASNQTGAAGRERQHQDKAAEKLKQALADRGITARIVTPEEHGDYQSYDNYLERMASDGVHIVPLHFDAAGGSFLTRTRKGDTGDSSFAAPIQEALTDFQRNNTNLGGIRQDTMANATINAAAASPAALVELGVMVDWERHYGSNFTSSEKFKELIDKVADGIKTGGNFEKKQRGGYVNLETNHSKSNLSLSSLTNSTNDTINGLTNASVSSSPWLSSTPINLSNDNYGQPKGWNPTSVRKNNKMKSGGSVRSKPKRKPNVAGLGKSLLNKIPKINAQQNTPFVSMGYKLPNLSGQETPSLGKVKTQDTSKGIQETPSLGKVKMQDTSKGIGVMDKIKGFVGFTRGGTTQKLNKGGMVSVKNQSTTRLSEASNNSIKRTKTRQRVIVMPPPSYPLPPIPTGGGGSPMMMQSKQSKLEMKSHINRINKGAMA
jgi:hypothetical protein